MPKVITTGRFDVTHPGHWNLLNHCRVLAGHEGKVIVMLDSDERIKDGDFRLPIIPYSIRLINLMALRWGNRTMVDEVICIDSDQQLNYEIARATPDYLVKGAEWLGKKVIGQEHATMVFYKPTANGLGDKISSSKIIEMVRKAYED